MLFSYIIECELAFSRGKDMKYIAFVCGHNSGRSQLAHGAFNCLKTLYPKVDAEYEAIAWGTGIDPKSGVNKKVIPLARRVGIDLSDKSIYFPKNADHDSLQPKLPKVVKVITMGCMDSACEIPPKIENLSTEDVVDWGLDDPASENTDVTAARDQILGYCLELIEDFRS